MTQTDPWTPTALDAALRAAGHRLPPEGADAVLRALESESAANPRDLALLRLIPQVHRHVLAGESLPLVVAGVHRDRLSWWDTTTTTWSGHDIETGRPARVRALDPGADRAAQGALARDARALDGLVPGLRAERRAIAVTLDPQGREPRPLRGLADALASADAWLAAGLGVPPDHPAPLGVIGGALRVVTLAPGLPDAGPLVRAAASWLRQRRAGTLADVVAAWSPDDLEGTAEAVRRHLADDLVTRWHAVRRRAHAGRRQGRHAGLLHAVRSLAEALPVPDLRTATGVDLDGRVQVAVAQGGQLTWGAERTPPRQVASPTGVDKALARQLLRARAVRAPSATLQARVAGSDADLDTLGRWLAAASRLHTVRLLLERVSPE